MDERDHLLRTPGFKSLGSRREGRHRSTLGQNHLPTGYTAAVYPTPSSSSSSSSGAQRKGMQYGSGNLQIPKVECQLAAKYVTSRPIDLPTVPEKTKVDEETNRILGNMELEKQTCEEDYCSNFDDQVYSISLVEVWMKGYEKDVKKLKTMGFKDDINSLAFAALPVLSTIPNSDVLDNLTTFCTNYNQMKGMGFSPSTIFGSLVKHKNNLEASVTDNL